MMHSQRKRTLSRGMSEDESLRHIIREAEESSRFLSRTNSRCGSLKRGQREESLGEEDLHNEMVELQAHYEVCLQEVRALEVQQEALLFQVDCLQDTLEGAEEMLSETRREAHCLTMELEREREVRKKLDNLVVSLMQEIKGLREERNSVSIITANELVKDQTQAVQNVLQGTDNSAVFSGTSVDGDIPQCPASAEEPVLTSTAGQPEQLQSRRAGPMWLQGAPEGTSVDQEENIDGFQVDLSRSSVLHLVKQTSCKSKQSQKNETSDRGDNDESSGYEDAPSEFCPSPSTPDMQPDADLQEDEFYESGNVSKDPKNAESCALS